MIFYLGKIVTEEELIKDLRERNCDPDNELSDSFLISEAYQIGEWEYTDDLKKRHRD